MIPALELFRPHHEELRQRLLASLAAVAVCSGLAWLLVDHMADFCTRPLFAAAPNLGKLVYTKLTDPFVAYLKLSLLAGIAASFPFLLYQAWMFAAPGLMEHERRLVRSIVFWSTGLFVAGALFSFFIVLPRTLAFFMSYADENLLPMPKLSLYLTFVARMTLAFAVAFEIPFLMVATSAAGLVSSSHFKTKRKHFYIVIAVLAFLLTAGDMTAAILLFFPLLCLYEAGILADKVFVRRRKE